MAAMADHAQRNENIAPIQGLIDSLHRRCRNNLTIITLRRDPDYGAQRSDFAVRMGAPTRSGVREDITDEAIPDSNRGAGLILNL